MSNIEVFGINGGHLGLWLGLSVIVCYNVIINYLLPFLKLLIYIIFKKLRLLCLHFTYRCIRPVILNLFVVAAQF